MERFLAGRVAVVTGAAGGLGRQVARQLATHGATVACADLDIDPCAETVEHIRDGGGTATATPVDVSDEASITRWRDEVRANLGPAAVVVTCAGVLVRTGLDTMDLDGFMRVQRINLGGTYATIRAFLPDLVAAGWGRIVTIGSIAGIGGYPYPAYGASKAGVVNLTRSLLVETWGTGVTVNTVCPGAMQTPMLRHEAVEQMRAKTPSARIATPEEIADVVLFFCRESSACINGASLVADGGATAVFRYFDE